MLSLPMGTGLPGCGPEGYVSAQEPWGLPSTWRSERIWETGGHEEGKGEEHRERKDSGPHSSGFQDRLGLLQTLFFPHTLVSFKCVKDGGNFAHPSMYHWKQTLHCVL